MSEAQWVHALAGRCQLLAGWLDHVPVETVLREMQRLVDDLPTGRKHAEQVVANSILSRSLLHVVHMAGLDRRIDVVSSVLQLAASPPSDEWLSGWAQITRTCMSTLEGPGIAAGVTEPRLAVMLQVLDTRFADPTLRVIDLAQPASLSASYAARVLKQLTGDGFVRHVRRRRVLAAGQLLTTTRLSVKEVASATGFVHASELSRQFKLIYHSTPTAFRVKHAPPGAPYFVRGT